MNVGKRVSQLHTVKATNVKLIERMDRSRNQRRKMQSTMSAEEQEEHVEMMRAAMAVFIVLTPRCQPTYTGQAPGGDANQPVTCTETPTRTPDWWNI